MQRLSIVACGLLASIWVASPALAAAPVIDLSEAGFSDRPRVTKSAADNNTTSTSAKPTTLDARLSRIERLFENQTLVDLTLRMEGMQQELQRMFGELEVVTHELNALKRRQRELYLDNDRRFKKLESSGTIGSSGGTATGGAAVTPGTGTKTGPRASSAGESGTIGKVPSAEFSDEQIQKTAYQSAFNLLRESKYDLAKIQFGGFISKFPNSTYADNAQYWLGEVNYVQRNFDVAITEFNKVLSNYPDSSKYADALLKIGLSQFELEKWPLATNAFKKIIEHYPNSSEARLANKRLQDIKLQKQ